MLDEFHIAEMRRQLANLVSLCEVVEVNKSRVKVKTADGITSEFLPVLSSKASKTAFFSELEVGERVLVIAAHDLDSGFVVGSFFAKDTEPDGSFSKRFSDGTELSYDEKTSALKVKVKKSISIEAKGPITVKAKAVTVEAEKVEINGKSTVDINGETGITLNQGKGALVTTLCNCLITGTPHASTVLNVKA